MSDFDFLSNLKGKINELKSRRDQINAELMTDRIHVS